MSWFSVVTVLGKHLIDAIDKGTQRRRARRRARRAKQKRQAQAGGQAAYISSKETEKMMRKRDD